MCLFSAPGALMSAFLTVIKFRSEYRCDTSLLNACSSWDWFDCNSVLSSPWATPFAKLPISVYSTAFYIVLFGLGLSALGSPRRLLPVVRPMILWMAWTGTGAVTCLFCYAYLVVGSGCSYCTVIYGLTLTILLAASIMNPGGHRAGLAALFVRTASRGGVWVLAILAFMALISVQMVQYLRVAQVDVANCTSEVGLLPESDVMVKAEHPRAEIAVFIDLACEFCKKEYEMWRQFVADARPGQYRLAVYHYARNGKCVPDAYDRDDRKATANDSCLAALAVECAEREMPGAGLRMVDKLFALQGGNTPLFDEERVADAARAAGLKDIPRDSRDGPFLQCLQDKEPAPFVREHGRFCIDQGIVSTPVTYLTFYEDDGSPLPLVIHLLGNKDYRNIDRLLEAARTAAGGSVSREQAER